MALRAHDGRTRSKLPARLASRGQEAHSQRKFAFERLGLNGSQNREKKEDHTQSNQVEDPREEWSRASYHSSPRLFPRLNNSWQEGGVESEYKEARMHDRFPCFSSQLASVWLPHKFKPSNHSKYDGKTEPRQWLRIYSLSIELAGGDNDIKALFFPMALETMPPLMVRQIEPRVN
jgi:hypothetical protein